MSSRHQGVILAEASSAIAHCNVARVVMTDKGPAVARELSSLLEDRVRMEPKDVNTKKQLFYFLSNVEVHVM